MAARKRKTDYAIAGRPPKDPKLKVGTPVRCLTTKSVADAIASAAEKHGIPAPTFGTVASDIVRLYIFNGLKADGKMTAEIEKDPTWDTLKERGLI